MKPSKMKKDGNASIRINKTLKAQLEKNGISVQKIVDDYLDLNVEIKVKKVDRKNN